MPRLKSPEIQTGVILHLQELVPELPDIKIITDWLVRILRQESRGLHCIFYVFLDDESLLKINREHLHHNTYTDTITFPYHDDPIEAEIYISVDRVRANAKEYGVPVYEELLRVMAHGVLHLCGWSDKTESQTLLMRKRENACLSFIGVHLISSLSPS
ncbi:MAG TPA: rRNA maturation RNase YbeY [Saprospiraceae bacterium]|nr:rRNA maturation RNase YbeY [Saprospiraceae bacterium]